MTAKSAEPQSDDPFVVTIDGPAGVGKSTTARLLAKELGLVYLDTGATYRALAYAALQKGLHPLQRLRKSPSLPATCASNSITKPTRSCASR